eukprot:UN06817
MNNNNPNVKNNNSSATSSIAPTNKHNTSGVFMNASNSSLPHQQQQQQQHHVVSADYNSNHNPFAMNTIYQSTYQPSFHGSGIGGGGMHTLNGNNTTYIPPFQDLMMPDDAS